MSCVCVLGCVCAVLGREVTRVKGMGGWGGIVRGKERAMMWNEIGCKVGTTAVVSARSPRVLDRPDMAPLCINAIELFCERKDLTEYNLLNAPLVVVYTCMSESDYEHLRSCPCACASHSLPHHTF